MVPGKAETSQIDSIDVDLPVAELGTRGLAQIIDFILLILATTVTVSILVSLSAAVPVLRNALLIVNLIFSAAIFWGYFVLFEILASQSPGKKIMGLRVVDSRGGRLTPSQSCIRNIIRFADWVPIFYGVGLVAMILSSRSQRLGDMVAGTLVIRLRENGDGGRMSIRRYPPDFTREEIAVFEDYLDRSHLMLDERRTNLCDQLIAHLVREHPDLVRSVPPPGDSSGRLRFLYLLFPPLSGDDAELRNVR